MLNFSHVSTPVASALPKSRTAAIARIGWMLLILVTLYVCYFRNLSAIGFVGPDEPRYAWVAREMAESGDWVTPRLYGKPWFEKPPLLYWGAALCFKLFGVSEATARLPSAISALLATLALAWLAWRIYGAETARWLLLLLPTTVGMIGFSHACATDMPFAAMLTIAMVAATVLLRFECGGSTGLLPGQTACSGVTFLKSSTLVTSVIFGFFLALAVLAKGPAAIILCAGSVFFWALFTKRWRDALSLLHPAGTAAFCVTAFPWYILCARRHPDFLHIFIIEHNFKRFLTPEFQHIQPWWFYIPVTAVALLPWLVWAFAIRRDAFLESQREESRGCAVFLLAWGVFPILFFSVSESKLPGYVLPAVPSLCLLLTAVASKTINQTRSAALWPLLGAGMLFVGSVAWGLTDLFQYHDPTHAHWTFYVGALFVLFFCIPATIGGLAIISALAWRRFGLAQVCALVSFLLMTMVAQDSVRKLTWKISARSMASEISEPSPETVFAFEMRRAWLYQLNFYLHQEVREWTPAHAGTALVVTPAKAIPMLKNKAEILEIVSDFSPEANLVKVQRLTAAPDGKPQ
jgi:4-amino-4-deoxy-L-arabinose transferase-like glycosyltransferase